jgi:hypothetical protein
MIKIIFRQLSLNFNKPVVVPRISHNTDDSMTHMNRSMKLYQFESNKIPIFWQNFFDLLPNNILSEHSHLVTSNETDRVDNISYQEYNNPELWWLICYINNIDPENISDKDVLRVLPFDYLVNNYLRYEI